VGDDDLEAPLHSEITQALARLAGEGVGVHLLHGNRDFLLGPAFAAAARVQLLPDPALIDLYGTPTLLTHGDTLCSDDTAYLSFRAQVRDAGWQVDFLGKPLPLRKSLADYWRMSSEREKRGKPSALMDVTPDAVADILRRHGYPRLIHGHTHRPGEHQHAVDGHACDRWVLPAWDVAGGYLRCAADGCLLVVQQVLNPMIPE
jgi:UDP-2,3-diacylglucosamine hydrolase